NRPLIAPTSVSVAASGTGTHHGAISEGLISIKTGRDQKSLGRVVSQKDNVEIESGQHLHVIRTVEGEAVSLKGEDLTIEREVYRETFKGGYKDVVGAELDVHARSKDASLEANNKIDVIGSNLLAPK